MIKSMKKIIPGVVISSALLYSSFTNVHAEEPLNKELPQKINFSYKYNPENLKSVEVIYENLEAKSEKEISFINNGESQTVTSKASTVKEFLDENKVELGKFDTVIPSLESSLKNEDSVVLIQELKTQRKVNLEIDFESTEEFSFELPFGETKVIQEGEKGNLEQRFDRITKNSVILSDELVSEKITKEPVEEKIAIGTKEEVKETISFETINKTDNTMYEGETKVVQEGQEGERTITYENKDGEKKLISDEVTKKPVDKVVVTGNKKNNTYVKNFSGNSANSNAKYSLSQFQFHGVIFSGGKKFTYYSQSVLPGGGLRIPGRHVSEAGYVSDKDGFIVVASNRSIPKGSVIDTPFGAKGKVYDICASCSPEWFDIYTK